MRRQVLPPAVRKGRRPSEEASRVRDIAVDTTFPKRQNGRVRPLQAQRLRLFNDPVGTGYAHLAWLDDCASLLCLSVCE